MERNGKETGLYDMIDDYKNGRYNTGSVGTDAPADRMRDFGFGEAAARGKRSRGKNTREGAA